MAGWLWMYTVCRGVWMCCLASCVWTDRGCDGERARIIIQLGVGIRCSLRAHSITSSPHKTRLYGRTGGYVFDNNMRSSCDTALIIQPMIFHHLKHFPRATKHILSLIVRISKLQGGGDARQRLVLFHTTIVCFLTITLS
jgi:hypothetical protein